MSMPWLGVPNYAVTTVLGSDGAATAWEAVGDSGDHAILTIGREPLRNPEARAAFLDWTGRLAHLGRHPHIADLRASGLTGDGHPYLVVAAARPTLAERLLYDGPLRLPVVRELGVAIADALAAAHRTELSHGFVRPSTVGMTTPVQLTGFAMAAPSLAQGLPVSAFTAPEHLGSASAGEYASSFAGDVYDLGVVLYVSLGGRLPWASEEGFGLTDIGLRSRRLPDIPGVAASLLDVLRSATGVGPRSRPTAAEVRDALAAADTEGAAVDGAAGKPQEVDKTAVQQGRLRETAVTAAVSAAVSAVTTEAVGAAKGVFGPAAGQASGTAPATGAAATGAAATGPAATTPGGAAVGWASIITTKVVLVTTLAVAVTAAAGVGGVLAYKHFTCGSVIAGRPVAEVLNTAVRRLRQDSYAFTVRYGDLSATGMYDSRGPVGQMTMRYQSETADVILDHGRIFLKDSEVTGGKWTVVTDQNEQVAEVTNPVKTASYLTSTHDATSSHCTFRGTFNPTVVGLPASAAPVPFEATVDPGGRLTNVKFSVRASATGGQTATDLAASFSDYGKKVTVTPPPVG